MSLRVTPWAVIPLVLLWTVCGSISYADDLDGASEFVTGRGGINVQRGTSEAQLSAQTEQSSGGYSQAPQVAAGVGMAQGSAVDPWAKYTAVMKPGSDVVQMCLWLNAGLPDVSGSRVQVCYDAAPPQDASGAAGGVVDPGAMAASAVARLVVPEPVVVLSPHPSDNQWGVLAVGLPIWVWADDPGPIGTAVNEQGIDIQLQATRGSVRFDWGDGSSSVCTQMRPRPPGVDPLIGSADCGHTYLRRGDYTVTATAGWAVSWSALGQSGSLPLTSSATTVVPIREFRSVVVG